MFMRIHKRKRHSISSDKLNLNCPTSWRELTQSQLRYVFSLVGSGLYSLIEIKTLLFIRFTGIKILGRERDGFSCCVKDGGTRFIFSLSTWQVHSFARQMSFVDSYDDLGCRLETIQRFRAVGVIPRELRFIDYLNCEKYYQLFLQQKRPEYVCHLASMLYRDKRGNAAVIKSLKPEEATGVIYWFGYIKACMAKAFPHFFKPLKSESSESYDIVSAMDAQIRALTDGDITKEDAVFNKSCWRALTELNQKAREAEEFRKKYGK